MRRRLRLLLNLLKSAGQNDKPAGVKLTGFGCANNQTQTLMYFANRLTMPSKEPGVVGTLAIWPSRQARKLLLRLIRRVQQENDHRGHRNGLQNDARKLVPGNLTLSSFRDPGAISSRSFALRPAGQNFDPPPPASRHWCKPECVWSHKSCSGKRILQPVAGLRQRR